MGRGEKGVGRVWLGYASVSGSCGVRLSDGWLLSLSPAVTSPIAAPRIGDTTFRYRFSLAAWPSTGLLHRRSRVTKKKKKSISIPIRIVPFPSHPSEVRS